MAKKKIFGDKRSKQGRAEAFWWSVISGIFSLIFLLLKSLFKILFNLISIIFKFFMGLFEKK